VQAR